MKSATNRTFNNTVLLGAEMALALAAVLGTSVPMARMLGPTKLSYYLYIQWIAMASGNIALLGIPLTTRRYMAEVLGQGDLPMARGVFRATLRLQLLISLALLIVGETLVFTLSERAYWSSSWLIVLSLAPRMIMTIPSQAHAAAGRLHYNLIAYGLASVLLVSITNIGLRSGWGLVAAAAACVVANTVEMILKLAFVPRWLPRGEIKRPGQELRRRMAKFSKQNAILLVLNLVVWDKSDFFLLRLLKRDDTAQLAFFANAFNLADRAIQIVQVFVNGLGVALFSELGRSEQRLHEIARGGLRYVLLLASVLLLGLAAVGPALVLTLYGAKFAPAGPVLTVAALFGVGKCLMPLLGSLFQAAERQKAVLVWVSMCGVLNVALDALLIPGHGAMGAAIGNGVAQVSAAVGLVYWAGRSLRVQWPLMAALPGIAAGACCALAAWGATHLAQRPVLQLAAGMAAGALAYPVFLRVFRALNADDARRFGDLASRAPGWSRGALEFSLGLITGIKR